MGNKMKINCVFISHIQLQLSVKENCNCFSYRPGLHRLSFTGIPMPDLYAPPKNFTRRALYVKFISRLKQLNLKQRLNNLK